MQYDFDSTLDHRHNFSYRWDMPGMPDDVIGMGTADLDYTCAPAIREALVPIAEENCYNYRQRPASYYQAVVDFYRRRYGMEIQPEWLSNVPSTIGAVRIALEILTRPGDAVIVQTPVFQPLASAADGAGLRLIENPLKIVDHRYELDFADFEAKIEQYQPKACLLVNPHNPTGRVFEKDELSRLIDICAAHGVAMISDEVHGQIVYDGRTFTPILGVSEKAREISIQVMSLSKGYNIMSLPHAIITIANPKLQEAYMRQIRSFSFGYAVNSFALAAVTTILEGKCDAWMEQLSAYLERNLNEICADFEAHHLPLEVYRPEASFLLWVDCRKAGFDSSDLHQVFLDRAHIDLDDGAQNFGPAGAGFIRLNYAVTNAVLKEALARINQMFE